MSDRREFVRATAAVAGAALVPRAGQGPDPGANGGRAMGYAFAGLAAGFRAVQSPRLKARPSSLGANHVRLAPGVHTLGLDRRRDGAIRIPRSVAPSAGWPLIVALHGAGGSVESWASYHRYADELGFVLLVPESRGASWDIVGTSDFRFDPPFLDQALRFAFEHCPIDPTRVILAGFSDGASYALSLGVANGDLFTRLVAFSPGFVVRGVARVGRPAVFISHGTDDPVLPADRTREVIVPDLRARGYEVRYREFSGGHEMPGPITTEALRWGLR